MLKSYLMFEVLLVALLGFGLTLAIIPWLGRLAARIGLVDAPDAHRKLHREPIPLVGGIALFFCTIAAIALLFAARFVWFAGWSGWTAGFSGISVNPWDVGGLLAGASVLLLVGILDDWVGLRGRQKLLGQLLACVILVACGFQFSRFEIRSGLFHTINIDFGSFAAIASCLWLLCAINSINLLDGADGFAGTIGVVMGIAFSVMALSTGAVMDAVIFAAFTGSILGFLRYNFPPAKVYLGDAGSMLIGLVFGALAIHCTLKQATAYAFFGPLALLAIPFLDTGAAIVRRRLTGRSIYSVDRAHLHHTLAGHGYGPRGSLLLVALLCSLTAAGGTLSVITHQSEYAVVAIAIAITFLVANRIFGFAELKLILSKFAALYSSLKSFRHKSSAKHRHLAVQLQGRRDWQLIWSDIRQFSEKHDFKMVKLHLHLPWLHEIYHARYDQARSDLVDASDEWFLVLPLCVEQRLVGEIEVVALRRPNFRPYETVRDLMDLIVDLEREFLDVMESDVEEEDSSGSFRTIPLTAWAGLGRQRKSSDTANLKRPDSGSSPTAIGG